MKDCNHQNIMTLAIYDYKTHTLTSKRCRDCNESFYDVKSHPSNDDLNEPIYAVKDQCENNNLSSKWDFNTALGDTIKEKYKDKYVNVIERQDVILRQPIKEKCDTCYHFDTVFDELSQILTCLTCGMRINYSIKKKNQVTIESYPREQTK